ncbi:MAG: exodeoxyribonuclease VII large subunit [Gemmatimonadales bacterium]
MTRKPRSPSGGDLFTASPAPKQPTNRPAFSVTELAHELKRATEQVTGQVWVKGEVMGLKEYGAGHWYFTLRDEESQLRCVMWRTYTQRLKVPVPEGTEVFLLATPTVWPQRGELRLTAVAMLPTAGIGLQQLTFERTREQLERDGLLDPTRKRALPAFPRMIAVVTSPDGVVLHDIVTVARRRWPATRIVLVPAKVQGEDAIDELVAALGIVNRLPGVDLCIVARGGGARDDLLAFNAEPVCRAVAAVTVPTVSAVGHETDVTLADLVADLRAPTPSAAAALALPDRAAVARDVGSLGNRLAQGLARRTTLASERLARLGDRAVGSLRGKVLERRRQWERLGLALDALSPLAVMGRGYSIAQRLDGTVIKRRDQVGPGDQFTVRVPDGLIPARGE